MKTLEARLDDQEQRSRNTCLLIHGCEETEGESTDDIALTVINNKMGINDFDINDIQRSHRLGPRNNIRQTRSSMQARPRPIIVTFCNFRKRRQVFTNKSTLKGMNVSISENLTKSRYLLYQASVTRYGKGNVWTVEDRITTKVNGKYVVINSKDDLV